MDEYDYYNWAQGEGRFQIGSCFLSRRNRWVNGRLGMIRGDGAPHEVDKRVTYKIGTEYTEYSTTRTALVTGIVYPFTAKRRRVQKESVAGLIQGFIKLGVCHYDFENQEPYANANTTSYDGNYPFGTLAGDYHSENSKISSIKVEEIEDDQELIDSLIEYHSEFKR